MYLFIYKYLFKDTFSRFLLKVILASEIKTKDSRSLLCSDPVCVYAMLYTSYTFHYYGDAPIPQWYISVRDPLVSFNNNSLPQLFCVIPHH